jgi:hypothetical protein
VIRSGDSTNEFERVLFHDFFENQITQLFIESRLNSVYVSIKEDLRE